MMRILRRAIGFGLVGASLLAFQNCSGSLVASPSETASAFESDPSQALTSTNNQLQSIFSNIDPTSQASVQQAIEALQQLLGSLLAVDVSLLPQSIASDLQKLISEIQAAITSLQGTNTSVPAPAPAPVSVCEFNGQILYNGQSVVAYFSDHSAPGQGCVSEVRNCTDSGLTGKYKYSSCVPTSEEPLVCQKTPDKFYACSPPLGSPPNTTIAPLDGSEKPNSEGYYSGKTATWKAGIKTDSTGKKSFSSTGNIWFDDLTYDKCMSLCAGSYVNYGTQRVCNYAEDGKDVKLEGGTIVKNGEVNRSCELITDYTCPRYDATHPGILSGTAFDLITGTQGLAGYSRKKGGTCKYGNF